MQTATFAGGSALDKAEGVVATFGDIWHGRILDVGCRTREMEKALAGHDVEYLGMDLYPPADIVANLGERIPLENRGVSVVTALDVLEHTDDFHYAFAELCRVADEHVVISLPNAYEIGTRFRILLGRPVSAKYGLPADAPRDRHRWFFALREASEFMQTNASRHGWSVAAERAIVGPRRDRVAPLVSKFPNVGAGTYLCWLTRT